MFSNKTSNNIRKPFKTFFLSTYRSQKGLERCLAVRENTFCLIDCGHDGASFVALSHFEKYICKAP